MSKSHPTEEADNFRSPIYTGGPVVRSVLATDATGAGKTGSAASVKGHIWTVSDSVNRLFAILFRWLKKPWKSIGYRDGMPPLVFKARPESTLQPNPSGAKFRHLAANSEMGSDARRSSVGRITSGSGQKRVAGSAPRSGPGHLWRGALHDTLRPRRSPVARRGLRVS